jgi:hypothetical protein
MLEISTTEDKFYDNLFSKLTYQPQNSEPGFIQK